MLVNYIAIEMIHKAFIWITVVSSNRYKVGYDFLNLMTVFVPQVLGKCYCIMWRTGCFPLSLALFGLLSTRKCGFRVQEHNSCLRICKLVIFPMSVALCVIFFLWNYMIYPRKTEKKSLISVHSRNNSSIQFNSLEKYCFVFCLFVLD